VKFYESNGSKGEQVSENLVDDEESPSQSIFRMGGEVMPRDVQVQALVDISNQDPSSSTSNLSCWYERSLASSYLSGL
jgi:hypothetical protein